MSACSTIRLILLICMGSVTTNAMATSTVVGGFLDGSGPKVAGLPNNTCPGEASAYAEATLSVGASGTYLIGNAYFRLEQFGAPAVTVLLYAGEFDARFPTRGLVASQPAGWGPTTALLQQGQTYSLLVQQSCEAKEGAWSVAFNGPGRIESGNHLDLPAFSSGSVSSTDPYTQDLTLCDGLVSDQRIHYKQIGPIRVQKSGTYYFTDPFAGTGFMSTCLAVYDRPPNPADLGHDTVATLHPYGIVELQAGQDYYFVVQPNDGRVAGDYFFLLVPPAPFRINAGMSDAWYNPETPGQGFFLDVLDKRNTLFLGWMTFDPDAGSGPAADQAWMTAYGPFSGSRARLDISWTQQPASEAGEVPEQYVDGVIELEFSSCASGRALYAWGGNTLGEPTHYGIIPLRRVSEDAVELCESLYAGPGLPGSL